MGPVVSVLVEMPFVRKGKESRGVAYRPLGHGNVPKGEHLSCHYVNIIYLHLLLNCFMAKFNISSSFKY